MLFEEFNSLVLRNSANKAGGHELFSHFHKTLHEMAFQTRYHVRLSEKCEATGWPIDIKLRDNSRAHQTGSGLLQFNRSPYFADTESSANRPKEMALYFLLQEEMCYNIETQQEEPLALQRLMLKHVQSISGVPVRYVEENIFNHQVTKGDKEEVRKYLQDTVFKGFVN